MKKAKIFLSALTVLAVVGSALAFKAKNGNTFYSVCDTQTNTCRLGTPIFKLEKTDPSGAIAHYDLLNAPCKPGFICQTLTVFDN